MIVPYSLRLACLCLACFYACHLAAGLAVSLLSPAVIRFAGRLRAASAARILLALRLLPATLATLIVTALCIPSFLWFEPEAELEQVGLIFLLAAALGATVWSMSIGRAFLAILRSARFTRHCLHAGQITRLRGESWPALVLETAGPTVALTGIVHPMLVISRGLLRTLSEEELAVTLRHERAHHASRDNLKRLLVLLSPHPLPFLSTFRPLERAWLRFTEWAADDRATAGDSGLRLSLAAALVQVARMGAVAPAPPLTSSLLTEQADLAGRVERLLSPTPDQPLSLSALPPIAVVAVFSLIIILRSSTLSGVHHLLENFVR